MTSTLPCIIKYYIYIYSVCIYIYIYIEREREREYRTSLVAQMVKSLPAVWEIWTQTLGWEDPLEKEMATHSSILAWIIPWTEPGRIQSMGLQEIGQD